MTQADNRDGTKLSRRTALAGLAGATAVGITPAIAVGETDPIFEVIERHRAALEAYDEADEHFEAMDKLYPREKMPEESMTWSIEQASAWTMAESERCKGNPRDVAAERWNDQGEVADEITEELVATVPTTVAGFAAVLAHWSDVMEEDSCERDFDSTVLFLENLAEALKAIA
jgi:hypothetical protein